jgi:hypothetical protein
VLFNARARNTPDIFAYSDFQNARLGTQTRVIERVMIEDKGTPLPTPTARFTWFVRAQPTPLETFIPVMA